MFHSVFMTLNTDKAISVHHLKEIRFIQCSVHYCRVSVVDSLGKQVYNFVTHTAR